MYAALLPFLMLTVFFVNTLFAQTKWEEEPQYGIQSLYNPDTLNTVLGTVRRSDLVIPAWQERYIQIILLQTDFGQFEVHLAPKWYLEKYRIRIGVGDQIEVTGSQITIDNHAVMMAAEVRKGQQIFRLRNKFDGSPVWHQKIPVVTQPY